MNFIQKYGGLVALVILAIVNLTPFFSGGSILGATGTRFPNGLSADSTSPSAGQIRGTTLLTTGASTFGGTLTVTTSNAATSTAVVGCIQTYATSTATPVRFTLSPFTGTSTTQGAVSNFLVAAQYGSCPS